MQLFGLATNPETSVDWLCNAHVLKQASETAQILYTLLWRWDVVIEGPVECGDRGSFAVYKPAYVNHPVVLWAAGCRKHAEWVYRHAKALCLEYFARYGRIHLSQYHVDHWKAHIDARGWPTKMCEQISAEDWLLSFDTKTRAQLKWRIADINPPEGCLFGILALNMIGPRRCAYNDWTASFSEYYIYKQFISFKQEMKWTPVVFKRKFDEL